MRVRFCPSPTGTPHVGLDPHGAVQLGLRASMRRYVRVPAGGHRCRTRQRGKLSGAAGCPELAGAELRRGPRHRRPVRAVPAVGAWRDLPRRAGASAGSGRGLRSVLDRRGSGGPPRRRGPKPEAGLRQLRPRTHRGATRRVHRRGPQAGASAADARRGHHLARPGPRGHYVRGGCGSRFRADSRQRRSVVHLGQSGRRRADEDHPRACAARICCRPHHVRSRCIRR